MLEIFNKIATVNVIIYFFLAILIIAKYSRLGFLVKFVGIYVIISAAIELVSFTLYQAGINNMEFLHLYTLIEVAIVTHIFYIIYKAFGVKFDVRYLSYPTFVFIIINSLFVQNIDSYNSYGYVLSSALILGLSIYYFLLIIDKEAKNYNFVLVKWFIITLFLFHSISLIVMFFGDLLHGISKEIQSYVWTFRIIIILLQKIILSYCFIKLLFLKNNLEKV